MPAEAPAARVLAEATGRNAALGHENLGPLSESHGFLSQRVPEHDLPRPHDAWVAAVDELPELCRTLRVRQRLDELPALDASPESLDDRHLLRAASALGLLAHAYNNVPMRPPDRLPQNLVRPWLQTAERLGRPAFTLTNTDYIFDNWRLIDPHAPDPMRVENLRLLNPIWDHPQTDTFVLVLVELLARSAPLVGSAVRAQEACLRRDDETLKAELDSMIDTVRRLTRESLPKISANARAGPRRVDPVVWTKLFAMIPLPVRGAGAEVRNASGAETPYFHLLDVLLGRRAYETQLGHEAMRFREAHPPHWRNFLSAVAQEPIADYVHERRDRELSAVFAELADAYQGRHGLLARHRLKAFAYMEAAFKTGRSSTVTGFSGLFEDRAWETVDASFEAARVERVRSTHSERPLARVEQVEELCPGVNRVVLDVRGLALRCEPGDRCVILPESESELEPRPYWISSVTAERVELTVADLPAEIRPGAELPVRIVPRAGFSPPGDAAVAIVMLAEGIGVAPFVAFLEARARTPGTKNLLFAEPDDADASLPHRDLLLEHAQREGTEVHLVERVEDALREQGGGWRGARIYACGRAAFARRMMAAVAEGVDEPLADLIVQHRYEQEVLPTPTTPHAQIDASELARHTDPADSVWAAIGGRVYDLTAFAEIHPGGQKLIHSFAGMDATASYRLVEHHRDPSVEALLSVFEIGTMRRLELEPQAETLFRQWVRTLYGLVEIENAHRLDTSIRRELAPTPFRLQFAVEAHERFLHQTLSIVCRRFGELWQATSGDRALVDELEDVLAGPEARAARRRADEIERRLEHEGATAELDAWLTERQSAAATYLRRAKTLAASGVRIFELYEGAAPTKGYDALLDALRGLAPLTRAHLEAASPGAVSQVHDTGPGGVSVLS